VRHQPVNMYAEIMCRIWISQSAHLSENRGDMVIPQKLERSSSKSCLDSNWFIYWYSEHISSSEDADGGIKWI
jgi:hypothetical protein